MKDMLKKFLNTKYFAFFFYLAFAIVFWGIPRDFEFASRLLVYGDPAFILWSLKWWPYAISHGLNPFLTKAIWAPFGQDLAWTTSVPSIALIFSPITLSFGPVLSYNLATILSLALAPFGIYLICKSINLSQSSSIFGGLIFFFSSYVWGQLLGHLNLYVVFVIPFLIYLFILRFKNEIGSKKYILISGILLVFQFGISNEIYATFVTFSYIALFIMFYIFRKDEKYKKLILKTALEFFLAVLLSALLLLPYLYYIFYRYVKGPIFDPSHYEADPLNFFIPTPFTLLFGNLFEPISIKFIGWPTERGAYLGLPLIFIIVYFMLISWRSKNRFYIFLSSIFIVFVIASFGPYLTSLGHRFPLVMPWYIFTKMPLIKNALPMRFTLYIDIVAAIISAIWFEKSNINKNIKYAISFLAILFLIPNLNMYRGPQITYPSFISSGIYKKYIKQGENIIVFPTYGADDGPQGALWQMKTDLYFNLSQSLTTDTPKELRKDEDIHWFLYHFIWGDMKSDINPCSEYSFLSYLSKSKVGAILVPEDYKNQNLQKLLDTSGLKPVEVGGVIIYQIDSGYLDSKLKEAKNECSTYLSDVFSTLFSTAEEFLSKGGDPSKLYPKNLEENAYLPKSFGYETGSAINWTKNGGWIGRWDCPDGKGKCFGIGIVGSIDQVKPIIDSYKSQALQIFFPYPKLYNPNSSQGTGQLLMIFRDPEPKKKE